jgi:iron complex outermembrane receptor protein
VNGEARKTLKSALMAGAAMATIASIAPAYAQDAPVEKVVVTGSRIPQKGLTSSSPVSTISATEQRIQGTTSSEELINSMPQVLANQGAEVSNGSSGTATLDLRGNGPQRTLILINGRRLNPASSTQPTPDVNNIALAMVERVEVLTGGASAVYGADAVAGVVNFIYRKNFEGVEVGAQYRITDHENSDQFSRNLIATAAALNPNEFALPDEHVNDGRIVQIYGIMGANTSDGKGNVMLFAQYRHAQPILQSERDFSACSISTNGGGTGVHVCQGSVNSAFGSMFSFDVATPLRRQTATGTQNIAEAQYTAALHNFNFGPANYLQRPDERYILGALGHYELAPDAELYAEFQYNDDRTIAQIAASGLFHGSGLARGNYLLNCDNPFMTPAGVAVGDRPLDIYCLDAGLGSTGIASLSIGRRFVEGGDRQDDFRHTSFRSVLGLKGTFEDIAWDYDVFAQYGQTVQSRTYLNDVSLSRISRSLQVVNTGPDGILGNADDAPICTSVLNGSDTSCVPFDVFRTGTLNEGLLSYLVTPGFQIGTTSEWVVNASFNGETGIVSPWAESPLSAAFGGEYRQEKLEHRVDTAFATGDLAGQGGPTPSTQGSFDVWEAFGEISLPIVEDAPFAKQIEINGGYRISDYETAGITHTYKYGGSWSPTEDVRFRGSFQRAVRAPNVVELFGTSFLGLWGGQDPCASTTTSPPAFTATQCANLGLTAVQIANFAASPNFSCPSAQCAARFSGNANLKPEESDTQSFGVVFTPTFLKGFNASVDYFDIFVDKVIGVVPQAVILTTCATDPGNSLCSKINRAAGSGILFGSGFIDSPTENLGSIQTTGLDIDANYRLDLGDVIGMDGNALTFNLVATRVFTHEATPLPGGATYDCVGLYGPTCGVTVGSASPVAEWRHKLRTTWGTPWDMNISLAWRRIGETSYEGNSPDPSLNNGVNNTADATIRAYDYFDLAFDWSLSDNIKLTGGVNNLADEDPPILDSNVLGVSGPPFGNANTYPVIYDSIGREVFIGMSTRF